MVDYIDYDYYKTFFPDTAPDESEFNSLKIIAQYTIDAITKNRIA